MDAERGIAPLASDGFSPVFLRNATVYGASPRLRFDLVVNNLTAWAVATGAIRMKSDGTPWRPLVHVQDVSRAVLAALEAERGAVHGQAFNVGRDGENYQVRDVARIVGEEVPGCEVTFADGASPDTRSYPRQLRQDRRAPARLAAVVDGPRRRPRGPRRPGRARPGARRVRGPALLPHRPPPPAARRRRALGRPPVDGRRRRRLGRARALRQPVKLTGRRPIPSAPLPTADADPRLAARAPPPRPPTRASRAARAGRRSAFRWWTSA